MDFEDLGTDVDQECPHCNRKFQQPDEGDDETPLCPACGEEVEVSGWGDDEGGAWH